ncbi:MAG: hypothetical protein ABSB01_26705, partial [Streptosporangiaceae bacterium]
MCTSTSQLLGTAAATHPTVSWTSFTTWAERTFRPSGGQVTHAPRPSAALLPSWPGGRVVA